MGVFLLSFEVGIFEHDRELFGSVNPELCEARGFRILGPPSAILTNQLRQNRKSAESLGGNKGNETPIALWLLKFLYIISK